MAKQITTNKKLDNNLFKITVGTVNKKSPKVFYITLTCWASLNDAETQNGEYVISMVDKQIKALINNASKEYEFAREIVCVDCSAEGLNSGKNAYMTIDITILQNKYLTFNEIYNIASDFMAKNQKAMLAIFADNNLIVTKNKQHDRVLHKSQVS
jgi:hypothetical protein